MFHKENEARSLFSAFMCTLQKTLTYAVCFDRIRGSGRYFWYIFLALKLAPTVTCIYINVIYMLVIHCYIRKIRQGNMYAKNYGTNHLLSFKMRDKANYDYGHMMQTQTIHHFAEYLLRKIIYKLLRTVTSFKLLTDI